MKKIAFLSLIILIFSCSNETEKKETNKKENQLPLVIANEAKLKSFSQN